MSKDGNPDVREVVAQTLSNLGEKALPILEEMGKDKDFYVQKAAVQAKAKNIAEIETKEALPALERMSKDEDPYVQEAAVKVFDNLGERALPILERISRNDDFYIQKAAAQARIEILVKTKRERASPILEEMSRDEDLYVREAAAQALQKLKLHKWLLSTQKPLFATPLAKRLADRIFNIQKIVDELGKRFKDDFIGLTIFGSTSNGCFTEESNLGCGIIAKGRKTLEEFKTLIESLGLCEKRYIDLDEKCRVQEAGNEDALFSGLFFGDHNKLLEIQKIFLENINQKGWDVVREKILKRENSLCMTEVRLGLEEKLEKIQHAAAILRVPPSYEETLEIVGRKIAGK